ncbi:MAG: type IV secretory system conjugative DNA transfer family protein, partial [Defluviitaleaceae bacterium]|nr:type IV secretory system conjugative DNA transfer family protein [Defluviitaleaceae bacterium]
LVLCAVGIVPVVWLAVLIAPALGGGLEVMLENLAAAFENPFRLSWHEGSLRTILIFVIAYGLGIGIYFSTRRNTRPKEEHGSAKWGEPSKISRKYADKCLTENKLLTSDVRVGFDVHRHRRNLNILVVGGSGAGKTRFYCKPNILNCNTSFFCLDPKGYTYQGQTKRLSIKNRHTPFAAQVDERHT